MATLRTVHYPHTTHKPDWLLKIVGYLTMQLMLSISVIAFISVFQGSVSAQEKLNVLISDSMARPMLFNIQQQAIQVSYHPLGLIPDIYRLIGEQLSLPVYFVSLPRHQFSSGAANSLYDLHCGTAPNKTVQPTRYFWSKPLFEVRNVVISRNSGSQPLKGKIGTVEGFFYPALQEKFEQGVLIRDDMPNQDTLLKMFVLGRFPLAITDEYHFALTKCELQGKWPAEKQGYLLSVISSHPFHCAALTNSKHNAEHIVRTIDASENQIRQLSQRYLEPLNQSANLSH